MTTTTRVLAIAAFLVAAVAPLQAADYYVSPAGGGDGTIGSPTDLQSALTAASASPADDAVYLQAGTYPAAATFTYVARKTDTSALLLSGGRDAAFAVQTWDASSVLDGQGARRVMKLVGNGDEVNAAVTLENLTVQNGYTNEFAPFPGDNGNGAGVLAMNHNGALLRVVVGRCLVEDNVAEHPTSRGGGLDFSCDHELRDCTFRGNRAEGGGAVASGSTYPYTSALAPVIHGCTFSGNRSGNLGGSHLFSSMSLRVTQCTFSGIGGGASSGGCAVKSFNGGHPTFEGCEFRGNVSDYWAGGIQFWDAGGEIRNCLFEGNIAAILGDGRGGSFATFDDDAVATPRTITVVNSTFVGNAVLWTPYLGGAIYNGGETLVVKNCIFWDNGQPGQYGGAYALHNESGVGTVSYSDVQGGLAGTGFGAPTTSAGPRTSAPPGHTPTGSQPARRASTPGATPRSPPA